MNYKQLDQEFSDFINLRKRFPGYFTRWVFILLIVLLVSVSIFDLYLSDFDVKEIKYQCNMRGGFCQNPFYNNSQLPAWVCEKVPCDTPYLEGGFSVGRNDFLSNNRMLTVFLLLLLTFIINHILYCFKFETFVYRGKQWHLENNEVSDGKIES